MDFLIANPTDLELFLYISVAIAIQNAMINIFITVISITDIQKKILAMIVRREFTAFLGAITIPIRLS